VVWARTSRPARLRVVAEPEGGGPAVSAWLDTQADSDGTGQTALEGLSPDTRYRLRLIGVDPPGVARFRSAPLPQAAAAWRLAFGGDLAGQNVCRDAARGVPVFEAIRGRAPQLFVGLGDMIYADGVCLPRGALGNRQVPGGQEPSRHLEDFLARWRYARDDEGLRALLAETAYLPVWDDHEVVNDFGPTRAGARGPDGAPGSLLPPARRAFLAWNPVGPADGPSRLVRRTRLGRHLELFVLDTRSHRDPNDAPDRAEAPKTLLGAAQRAWLLDALSRSDATWKLVVSSVPIAIPTGSPEEAGRDGWSDFGQETGFERELGAILEALRGAGVRGLVFLTTDVHFASVLRYRPFPDAPRFQLREVVTGPLQAGLAPASATRRLDPTFRPERLFLHAPPEGGTRVASFEDATEWFNFGLLDVDRAGRLRVRVVNARDRVVYDATWLPEQATDAGPGDPDASAE
jgi:alkaline phosphatase D